MSVSRFLLGWTSKSLRHLSHCNSLSLLLHTDTSVGLGSSLVRSDGFMDVLPRGEFSAHQRLREESRCSGSRCISATVVGSECRPDE